MRHIFQNRSNTPGLSTTATAAINIVRWAKDIANALEFIHSQGIVHRDLKLENILVSREYDAHITVEVEASMVLTPR